MSKYWLHRISWEWQVSYPLLDRGFLSIGFCDFGTKELLEKLREDFEGTIEAQWGSYGRNRFYLKNFVLGGSDDDRGMQKGDYVVVPKRWTFDIYEIVSDEVITSEDILDEVRVKAIVDYRNGTDSIQRDKILKDSYGNVVKLNDNRYLLADNRIIDLGFFWEVKLVASDIKRSDYSDTPLGSCLRFLGTNLLLKESAITTINEIISIKKDETQKLELNKDIEATKKAIDSDTKKLVKEYLSRIGAEKIKEGDDEECKKNGVDVIASFDKIDSEIYVKVQTTTENVKDWINDQIKTFKSQKDIANDPTMLWLISNDSYFPESIKKEAGIGLKIDSKQDFEEVYLNLPQDGNENEKKEINYFTTLTSIIEKIKADFKKSGNIEFEDTENDGRCQLLIDKKGQVVVYPIIFELQNIKYILEIVKKQLSTATYRYGLVVGDNMCLMFSKKYAEYDFISISLQKAIDIIANNSDDVFKSELKNRLDSKRRELLNNNRELVEHLVSSDGLKYCFKEGYETEFWEELFSVEELPKTIYKYTTLESVFSMLNNGTYRMNGLSGMNDTTEADYVEKYCGVELPTPEEINSFFIVCGNNKEDDLTMWRLYGDDGKGVCLAFDIDMQYRYDFLLHKVDYAQRRGEHAMLNIIKNLINSGVEFKELYKWKNFFKPYDYKIEDETRLLYFNRWSKDLQWTKTDKNIVNPSIDFSIKKDKFPLKLTKIILGPKCSEQEVNVRQLKVLIEDKQYFGSTNIEITTSSIDNYR